MNKRSLLVAAGTTFALLGMVGGAAIASAHTFSAPNGMKHASGMRDMRPGHEEIQEALTQGDFETWKSLMEQYAPQTEQQNITEDQFIELRKMHELFQAGDIESAKEIAKNLGLDQKPVRPDHRQFNGVKKERTAEQIAQFEQVQALLKEGNKEAADALAKELGIPFFRNHQERVVQEQES